MKTMSWIDQRQMMTKNNEMKIIQKFDENKLYDPTLLKGYAGYICQLFWYYLHKFVPDFD